MGGQLLLIITSQSKKATVLHDLNTVLNNFQSAGGPCQVIVLKWETHQQPRTMSPTGIAPEQNSARFVFGPQSYEHPS